MAIKGSLHPNQKFEFTNFFLLFSPCYQKQCVELSTRDFMGFVAKLNKNSSNVKKCVKENDLNINYILFPFLKKINFT